LLETWLSAHFENERMFARALKIDFGQHEIAHMHLLEEFQTLQDKLLLKRLMDSSCKSNSYYRFLHDWLIGHIVRYDMQMKLALLNFPYDYVPSGQCAVD
jgi:hemerythrin